VIHFIEFRLVHLTLSNVHVLSKSANCEGKGFMNEFPGGVSMTTGENPKYALEACQVNRTDVKSLEFTVTRVLIKIVKTNSKGHRYRM